MGNSKITHADVLLTHNMSISSGVAFPSTKKGQQELIIKNAMVKQIYLFRLFYYLLLSLLLLLLLLLLLFTPFICL